MAKYTVHCFMPISLEIDVDAEHETEAEDRAYEFINLSGMVGNRGRGDKLIGTPHHNVRLRPVDDCELLESKGFKITVEKK